MCFTVGLIAFVHGATEAVIISFAMLGALLAFLRYNWFPAKLLIGDIGTLTIGAVVAVSVIVGNVERVGMILVIPFFVELFLKLRGKLKEQSWCGVRGGKLVCGDRNKVYGLGRLVMNLTGGVSERNLVLTLIFVECVFAFIALAITLPLL
jgi:UDP-N-acetylglucosamine--dolichyl-phosphate N-acetylglucosaminephosphotransferase